ncbi:hypothetical protein [Marinobacterium sediminicola]|uniref:Uncharacterized protein n=1 Tax=Marinobacterium sediminicola TaxID=518898 RepID=A0ABY1S3N2_9GAMM|nr:hypothetical protein [Marinobacterium sediminicola]ULG68188.1 hypothetical protein LN244_10795 [Marinobacterium sediminicola]SMR77715.1 hypothetical protein SAMN04487964_11649 [Marinobacterium sediminicola]
MSDNTCAPSIGGARSIIPVLIAALLLQWLLASYQLDYRWAKWLFNQQGGQWLLKEHWLTADLIHTGGRRFSILLVSVFILLYLVSFWLQRLLCWRRELAYLSLAPLLASAVVLVSLCLAGKLDAKPSSCVAVEGQDMIGHEYLRGESR